MLKGDPHWLADAPASGKRVPVNAEIDELGLDLKEFREQLVIALTKEPTGIRLCL